MFGELQDLSGRTSPPSLWSSDRPSSSCGACAASADNQGLTLVHLPAQRKPFLWDKGCFGGVYGVVMPGVAGVLWAFGGVLSVRNVSG